MCARAAAWHVQGVETQRAFLVPSDVPADTPWNTERGWDPETEAEDELRADLLLSDHRPLIVDFAVSPPSL